MSKSANLYTRIEPDVKEQAEKILSTLGIPASSAINMFYKQIILQRGIPFEVKLPKESRLDMSTMTDEVLSKELEKGYTDVNEGRVKDAKEVFNNIRKDYNPCRCDPLVQK
jgi:DNA-damage-inducible protein J